MLSYKIYHQTINKDRKMCLKCVITRVLKLMKKQINIADFALHVHYYGILVAFGCIGILIYLMTVIGLNFSSEYGVFIYFFYFSR